MIIDMFKSRERLKILYYCLYRKDFTVVQTSRETGVTKGLVSRYLNKLYKFNLIDRKGRTYFLKDSIRLEVIKLLLNLNKIDEYSLKREWMEGIGLFGSWAQGKNTNESDVDIWIKTKIYPPEIELGKLQDKIKIMTESEVNIVILTPKKIKELREKDKPFYNSLVKDSIVLWGEPIEL